MKVPLRTITERVGRHAVRLSCGHVETLAVGEAEAIGRKLACERCAANAEGGLSISDLAELYGGRRRGARS